MEHISDRTGSEKADVLKEIRTRLRGRGKFKLDKFATSYEEAYRMREEPDEINDLRNRFARDIDRIVFCSYYKRLADKTQVYTLPYNPVISRRMSHAQELARIARKAAQGLGLNEDLVEAITLGHDLGHVFSSHMGEVVLSEISKTYKLGNFHHSTQSLRIVDLIAHRDGFPGGTGLNLTFQTRNGILFHDGEADENNVEPHRFSDDDREATENFMKEFIKKRKKETPSDVKVFTEENPWVPASLEGLLVRFLDTVSYVGADIEDAIRLGLIERGWLPWECVAEFGNTNRQIIDALWEDLVIHSYDRSLIGFSSETFGLLKKLKDFNRDKIYWVKEEIIRDKKFKDARFNNPALFRLKDFNKKIKLLFEEFLYDLNQLFGYKPLDYNPEKNRSSPYASAIFRFLEGQNSNYFEQCAKEGGAPLIVRDFLAGFTDQYFVDQLKIKERQRKVRKAAETRLRREKGEGEGKQPLLFGE